MTIFQEAEEAAAAEVLKLQQELEMEEAGLQPHLEEDENEDSDNAVDHAVAGDHGDVAGGGGGRNDETDNHVSKVPESSLIHSAILATNGALSDQQSYQLYVQAAKPAGPDDLEDANVVKDGADNADDNSLLSHDQEDSESQDPLSRRRRVRIVFYFSHIFFCFSCNV